MSVDVKVRTFAALTSKGRYYATHIATLPDLNSFPLLKHELKTYCGLTPKGKNQFWILDADFEDPRTDDKLCPHCMASRAKRKRDENKEPKASKAAPTLTPPHPTENAH